MHTKKSYRDFAREGFLYYALVTLFLAAEMFSYIFASPARGVMTCESWIYLVLASVGHAATLALPAFAVYLLVGRSGLRRTAVGIMAGVCALAAMLLLLNRQVYAIYRFHINGMIMNMITGPGAGDIFVLDPMLLVKELLILLLAAGAVVGLWFLAVTLFRRLGKAYVWQVSVMLVVCILFGHLYHAYAAFVRHAPVMRAAVTLPYHYPLTARSLMTSLGVREPEKGEFDGLSDLGGEIAYPTRPLETSVPDSLPDIYVILLDSWNRRAFSPEITPNAWRFAQENAMFTNHVSSSNGTRCSVFGIYFGVPGYYWESFEAARRTPVLIDRLQELGYDIQAYPSANLHNPDFRRMVFRNVVGLNADSYGGATVLDNDSILTERFVADMNARIAEPSKRDRPAFAFLFYDLPHAIALPADKNRRFTPAWDFADYTKLDNDLDPTEFWNLYLNCVYQDDLLLGKALDAIARREASTGRKAVVIVTGDHGQEFNENRHNYWGHSSNFSLSQIGVPLIVSLPGVTEKGGVYGHRTTHYDFAPTLLGRYLGVVSPAETYSVGRDLTDSESRGWHIAGANLNFAFVIPGDTILEKGGAGELNVYDPHMNPVVDYNADPAGMAETFEKLNRFFK